MSMVRDAVRGRTGEELLHDLEEFIPGGVLYRGKLSDEVRTVFARGQGSRIWDVDGNEYIDYVLGSGPMILGHAHPAVTRALQDRVELGTQFMQPTDVMLKHARKVMSAIPGAEKIKYTGTGSEATFVAMRLARVYTGRSKILKFEGAFHGTNDYVSFSTNPTQMLPFPRPEPDTGGIPSGVADTVLIAPYNDADQTCEIIRQNRDDLAAVILDPHTRHIAPRPEFLDAVRRCTQECGVVFILDEVVTGFRLAWGGAQELYGIDPDLTTLGKALGGGLSVGCIVGPDEIMSRLDPARKAQGEYAQGSGTFTANPLATAAGLAALEELERPGTYERLREMGARLRDGLKGVCEQFEVPALVASEGPTVDLKFTDRPEISDYRSERHLDHDLHGRIGTEMMKRGIFSMSGTGFYISTVHTGQEIDETVEVFEAALKASRLPNRRR
jgi:glutamate-1-semialdehyde 2,1-aminomutase